MNVLRSKCALRSLGAATLLSLLANTPGVAQVTVAVSPGSATEGAPASLDISVTSTSGTKPAALEWTLAYSRNDLIDMRLQAGPAATSAGKSLSCGSAAGSVRCVVWGMNTNAISGGTIATASFNVASHAASASALQITE